MFRYVLIVFLGFIVFSCRNSGEASTKAKLATEGKQAKMAGAPKREEARTLVYRNLGSDNSRMVWVSTGQFEMGANRFSDTQPVENMSDTGFWMDTHEVTNAQFSLFVEATGYQTLAERNLDPGKYPTVSLDRLVPGSLVFRPEQVKLNPSEPQKWWGFLAGANWRHPEGKGSTIQDRMDHPVRHMAYQDALAYATWAGKRLPREAEWAYAARAGKHDSPFYWGQDLNVGEQWQANTYQGDFPLHNNAADGFVNTAPVQSFPVNTFGIYDLVGNVSEWCVEDYRNSYDENTLPQDNKFGVESFGILRGGSYLSNEAFEKEQLAGRTEQGRIRHAREDWGFRCVSDEAGPGR